MKAIITTFIILALALSLFARESGKLMMGKVTSTTDRSITIETKDNSRLQVAVTSTTRYEKNGSVAAFSDVKVGDMVVIHADKDGDAFIANIVRFRTELRLDRRNPKYPAKAQK